MPSYSISSGSITPVTILTEDSIGSSPFFRCNENNNSNLTSTPDKRSSSSTYCRICHEDSSLEELIDPCECSGTLALIHTSCLEKWLSTSNTDHCEICDHPFYIQKKNKSIFKRKFCDNCHRIMMKLETCFITESVWQWWRSRKVHGARGFAGDAICLVVLTPLCIAATYLCGIGASAYTRLGFWEGTGLAILCCMLVATYCLWFVVTVRFHYKSWRDWRGQNQDIKLLVKHCSDEERKKAKLALEKSITKSLQDRNNNRSVVLEGTMSPRVNRLSSWFGANFRQSNDPLFVVQQTTFV